MGLQISLPGLESPQAGGDVLFFAALPDPRAALKMHELAWRLRARHQLPSKPMPAERLHVTLQTLGAFDGVPEEAMALADRVAGRLAVAPFEVCFDRAMSFSGSGGSEVQRAFVLRESQRSEELMNLHLLLTRGLRALGQPAAGGRAFAAHVTLLYDPRRVAEEPVEPIRWTVDTLVLIRSQVGSGKPYQILRRWQLPTLSS